MPKAKPIDMSIDVATFAELRPALRQQMIDSGKSREDADEIIDLSFHAAREALEAFQRVMFTASGPLMTLTIAGMGAMLVEHKLDALRNSIGELAESLDLTGSIQRVEVAIGKEAAQ